MVGIGAGLAVEGMVALYIHRKGEPHKLTIAYGKAEGLLIKKVSPAAYGLSQHQAGGYAVRKLQKAYLPDSGIDEHTEKPAYYRAVYGQASFPYIQGAYGV